MYTYISIDIRGWLKQMNFKMISDMFMGPHDLPGLSVNGDFKMDYKRGHGTKYN